MEKKSALIFGLLIVLLSLATRLVLSQGDGELPRLTTVCENKAGLLHGFNDGFSVLKFCPKNSRKVILGESKYENSGNLNVKNIAFVSTGDNNPIYVYVLDNNGKAWKNAPYEDSIFRRCLGSDLPIGMMIDNIVDWNENSLVTKEGKIYVNKDEGNWLLATFEN